MARNKPENKIIGIKPVFESILVCNDRHLEPFIEIVVQEPENITSQNLGTLIGVLEVTDDSEDSSYIVNYLISVIKKEYFSKPKRGPVESLESALHKVNLALSGLAEHGNIKWLGKLNALIAVTEKNSLHLSQAGTAGAFLLRSKILTNISDGLAPTEIEPNPLKTFVSVSSGRLEKDDKLIITTDSIFDIFSLEEIKKSSLRFSNAEFVQFLRTALGSELQKAAVLVADLKDQEKIIPPTAKRTTKETNVFSSEAFIGKSTRESEQQAETTEEIRKEIQADAQEFTDEKTGHIYIKESRENIPPQEDDGVNYFEIISEKLIGWSKNLSLASLKAPWDKLKNLRPAQLPKIHLPEIKNKLNYQTKTDNIRQLATTKFSALLSVIKNTSSKIGSLLKASFSQKNKEHAAKLSRAASNKLLSGVSTIVPNLERIKKNIRKMDYQQRLYAILILVLIFIVPLVGLKIKNSFDQEKPLPITTEAPAIIPPLTQDKNVIRIDSLSSIYSGNKILKTINLNDKIFAITASEIIDLEKNKAFTIPSDFGTPKFATGMQDLNLLFLMNNNNQINSFSPISSTFQSNNLAIPADANISAIGTYLTYIYLVDAKNNQIYRYPRAEGGFGASTNWFKDSADLANTVDMALGDNIFLADKKNTILKLFRGKSQDFSIEETATPISITAIALGEQAGNIFILDAQNSRIIQLDATGTITAQYYNAEINSATSLAINEATKTIYISSENSIKTLDIN
jgi:hypothetical protein